MVDIISIGDATEDVFVQVKEAKVKCKPGTSDCTITMPFATKIPAERVDKLTGGNAANTAIGSRRLGMSSAFYVVLGDDEQGRRIKRGMQKEKVSTKYIQLKKGTSTNYSVVINHGAERTIIVYHVPRKYVLPKLEKAQWCYYTSMGHGFERLHKPIIKWVNKYDVKLGFNPGTHQMRKGKKFLSPMLKATHVCFLNKEETQLVTGSKSKDCRVLAKKLKALGPTIAVVTDGPQGSFAYDGKTIWYHDIFDVPVIERTGCGDSYSIGFLAGLHHGKSIPEAMSWGTLNAASVLQKIGPEAGLARKAWITSTIKKNPKFKAKVVG